MNRFSSGLLAVLLVLLLTLLAPLHAMAHGGGVAQVTDAPAGPYRLFAWTSPDPWRAGEAAHVTVAVTRVEGDQTFPITDAQVTVSLVLDAQPDQTLILPATPVSAVATGFYEVDHELPHDGVWRVEVAVTGAEGAGTVSFTMQAAPASRSNWLVWTGAAAALLVVVAVVIYLGARKRPGARVVTPPRGAPSSVVQE